MWMEHLEKAAEDMACATACAAEGMLTMVEGSCAKLKQIIKKRSENEDNVRTKRRENGEEVRGQTNEKKTERGGA